MQEKQNTTNMDIIYAWLIGLNVTVLAAILVLSESIKTMLASRK